MYTHLFIYTYVLYLWARLCTCGLWNGIRRKEKKTEMLGVLLCQQDCGGTRKLHLHFSDMIPTLNSGPLTISPSAPELFLLPGF
jgi:sorbitol-specific phosphotransferase system component IIBC